MGGEAMGGKNGAGGPTAPAAAPLVCFATCPPGVEGLAATEISRLGARIGEQERGGFAFAADLATLYRLHLHGRLLHRVVVRIATFRTGALPELFRRTGRLPWEEWLTASTTIEVRATSHRSRLYHSGAIAERVAKAVAARLATTDDGGTTELPPLLLFARLEENRCTLSLDASGELLHRRGYRLATAKAPLRESLACAVLELAGWRPELPLLDPMCGAGTFAIEAARLALGIAPGADRPFAFQRWRAFEPALWQRLVAEAAGQRRTTLPAPIRASDRDGSAVAAARANAERGGVAGAVELREGDLFDLAPDGEAGVVTLNPPYGRRIGGSDVADLYRRIGDHLRDRFGGWRYAILCPTTALADATHLPGNRHRLTHGGQQVVVTTGRLA